MTREEIIRLARQAGLTGLMEGGLIDYFERFAALVAAAERDACANLAMNQKNNDNQHDRRPYNLACNDILEAIRARGEE